MPRTAKNIYKRKDGRWEARYPIGKKENGNTKYASLYARSYSEAKELLLKAQTSRITPPPKKILFSEVLEKWMTVNDVNHKSATKLKYEYLIETHISPELGGYSVGDINESLINEFVRSKMTSGRIDKLGGLSENHVDYHTICSRLRCRTGMVSKVEIPNCKTSCGAKEHCNSQFL